MVCFGVVGTAVSASIKVQHQSATKWPFRLWEQVTTNKNYSQARGNTVPFRKGGNLRLRDQTASSHVLRELFQKENTEILPVRAAQSSPCLSTACLSTSLFFLGLFCYLPPKASFTEPWCCVMYTWRENTEGQVLHWHEWVRDDATTVSRDS